MPLTKNDLKQIKEVVDQATIPYFMAIQADFRQIDKRFNEAAQERNDISDKLDSLERRIICLEEIATEQGRELKKHTRLLNKHSKILDKHSKILDRHSKILDRHSKILGQHSKELKLIKAKLKSLQDKDYVVREEFQALEFRTQTIERKLELVS